MPWKVVVKSGKNITLKEVVEEIEREDEERRLVHEFEAEHRDEIDKILGLIDLFIDEGCIEERFPEVYKFGPKRLGIHFKERIVPEEYSSSYPINRGYNQLDYFRQLIRAYQG